MEKKSVKKTVQLQLNIKQQQYQHELSSRLTDDEKNKFARKFEELSSLCLASSVIELWLSEAPEHASLFRFGTGLLTFLKDYENKSYFLRFFCQGEELWSQEIYMPFRYHRVSEHFHYLPAQDHNAGFNFAFADEAAQFAHTVIAKYNAKVRVVGSKPPVKPTPMRRTTVAVKERTLEHANSMHDMSAGALHVSTAGGAESAKKPKSLSKKLFKTIKHSTYGSSKQRAAKKAAAASTTTGVMDKSLIGQPDDFRVVQQIRRTENNDLEINLASDDVDAQRMKQTLIKMRQVSSSSGNRSLHESESANTERSYRGNVSGAEGEEEEDDRGEDDEGEYDYGDEGEYEEEEYQEEETREEYIQNEHGHVEYDAGGDEIETDSDE